MAHLYLSANSLFSRLVSLGLPHRGLTRPATNRLTNQRNGVCSLYAVPPPPTPPVPFDRLSRPLTGLT